MMHNLGRDQKNISAFYGIAVIIHNIAFNIAGTKKINLVENMGVERDFGGIFVQNILNFEVGATHFHEGIVFGRGEFGTHGGYTSSCKESVKKPIFNVCFANGIIIQ